MSALPLKKRTWLASASMSVKCQKRKLNASFRVHFPRYEYVDHPMRMVVPNLRPTPRSWSFSHGL